MHCKNISSFLDGEICNNYPPGVSTWSILSRGKYDTTRLPVHESLKIFRSTNVVGNAGTDPTIHDVTDLDRAWGWLPLLEATNAMRRQPKRGGAPLLSPHRMPCALFPILVPPQLSSGARASAVVRSGVCGSVVVSRTIDPTEDDAPVWMAYSDSALAIFAYTPLEYFESQSFEHNQAQIFFLMR